MSFDNPKFEIGLNEPVDELPEASYFTPATDGQVVYSWPSGMSIRENTKLRYKDITPLREAMINFDQYRKENNTFIFLITHDEALILNMDALKEVYPTVIFLGIFDENNNFVESHAVEHLHQHCTFSTRSEALSCKDPSVIHILPKLTREEAVELFNANQDIICHVPGKHPERWYNKQHSNFRNSVSGCCNSYEIFIRFLMKLIEDVNKSDRELMSLCKEKVFTAIIELSSIQKQTNWFKYGEKFKEDLENLLLFKKSYQFRFSKQRKIPTCIKKGYHGVSEEYPPKFLETYRLKIPNRGFLGKLFYNYKNTFRMLNKISQYSIKNS